MRNLTRARLATLAIALTPITAGCGGAKGTSVSPGASRTVDVTMTDNAYLPTHLTVGQGETVTFRFRNDGAVEHEAVIGDDAAQMRHHEEMSAATAPMEHGKANHGGEATDTADAISVDPGRTGELVHTFTESGGLLIGCHEPGHWEAGMKANVTIG